jgi:hypothetical protein
VLRARLGKAKLKAAAARSGDASSRQIGERTGDTPCGFGGGGAARGEERSGARASEERGEAGARAPLL